jgi:hypothetical protein
MRGHVRSMRFLCLVIVTMTALFAVSTANAQEATGIEIMEYGLYDVGPSLGEFAPPNMGYRHETISQATHLETTRIVPGQVGVSFGVRYRVTGDQPRGIVPVRVVLIFPEQGLYSLEYRDELHVDETESLQMLGEPTYSGITFEEQWEIEPGIWTLQFWSGDQMLGEEHFEVITPPNS